MDPGSSCRRVRAVVRENVTRELRGSDDIVLVRDERHRPRWWQQVAVRPARMLHECEFAARQLVEICISFRVHSLRSGARRHADSRYQDSMQSLMRRARVGDAELDAQVHAADNALKEITDDAHLVRHPSEFVSCVSCMRERVMCITDRE